MKKAHLVVYHYDTGGVWAVLLAESAEEITKRLPEFKVVTERPEWMSADELARSERLHTDDLDELPRWLTEARERDRGWELEVERTRRSD
jgi:hypothetical protein